MSIHLTYNSTIEIRGRYSALTCDNGPSYIDERYLCWMKDGIHHREDGPAIIYFDESLKHQFSHGRFFLEGREYSNKEYKNLITKNEN